MAFPPKITGAKFGLATAVALGTLPMVGAEALATPAIPSDSLQVGTQAAATLLEGAETNFIQQAFGFIESPGQQITGAGTIVLLDPGTTSISDIDCHHYLHRNGVGGGSMRNLAGQREVEL